MKYIYAFDLDGTLTKKEILPVIAKELGIHHEMAQLTKKTMDGDIPFDQSFQMRVDMLKSIPISTVQKIIEKIPLSKHLTHFVSEHRENTYIVTGNLDVWIQPIVQKLGVKCLSSQAEYYGDKLSGIKTIIRKKDIGKETTLPVVAVGDGHNDLEMIMNSKIGIAYGGVHTPAASLLEVADYAIYQDKELCRFLKQLS